MAMEDLKNNVKSFWARPEGTTGMLVLAALGVGLYAAIPALLAFTAGLMALLGQTIAVVALCIVLAAMLYIVTNKKFLTLAKYAFKSVMRKITGWFVEIDPIGIMKSYIEDLIEKRATMETGRDKLQGQIGVLEKKIRDNTKGYDNAMALALQAQKSDNKGVLQVQSRQAGRLEKLNNESFIPLLAQLKVHLRAILKYYEVTGTVIDDLKNEVEAKKVEREMILTSYSAMSAAKKILQGGTDEKELFDQAMEFTVNDFGMKMGEIDAFIESSKGFVEGLDMQNGVYEASALEKLKAWENKADSILLGAAGKAQLLEHTASMPMNISTGAMPQAMTVGAQVDFDQLLKR